MQVTVENTDIWTITEHNNVNGIEIYHKPSCASVFMQGDDTMHFLAEYNAIADAHTRADSVWCNKTWNECLACVCGDYFGDGL